MPSATSGGCEAVNFRAIVGECRYLDQAEERALFDRWRAGDRDAGELLFRSVFHLMLSMVAEFCAANPVSSRDDAEMWATLGVLHAMRKFDTNRGRRLSTYMRAWVKNYLRRGLGEDRLIHVPVPVLERQRHVNPKYFADAERARAVLELPDDL